MRQIVSEYLVDVIIVKGLSVWNLFECVAADHLLREHGRSDCCSSCVGGTVEICHEIVN